MFLRTLLDSDIFPNTLRTSFFIQRFFKSSVMVLHIDWRVVSFRNSFHLLLTPDLHCHERLADFRLDFFEHGREEFKSFALVFLFGIFLRISAQMNSLAQVIQ